MLGLAETKAVVLVTMGALTLAVCLLPLLVRKLVIGRMQRGSTQSFMSGCLCFGGGVLMATVFLHLLPETRHLLQMAVAQDFFPASSYPLPELIVCCGFFFMYVTEVVMHTCLHRGHGGHSHLPVPKQDVEMNVEIRSKCKEKVQYSTKDGDTDDECLKKLKQEESSNGTLEAQGSAVEGELSVLRAIVVVVALSVHSIMEGLALGLVHKPSDVWLLFAALSSHKLIIGFCMGMELLEAKASNTSFYSSMIIFSLASPLGGLIGTLVVSMTTSATPAGVLVPTCLQGLSAGTILYVTFCEVLERERAKPQGTYLKMWTLLAGFLFMAALQVLDKFVPTEDPLLAEAETHSLTTFTSPYPIF
ncbi:zinc transporter ZIP1 [Procambarus clarkii]|uniref:zinc transporter ZIP1 n=1 Tax=Procambarus clarkii TaxID=6728 RepID=UPI001E671E75|nr:zinc transporter ZIP1-like [Procambarus clarkii]XP_045613315.1 zinc transporter ZIP1-like [Procambarus clarkii]XP_045613316.1 zinc transporter ZIP1-like [Procambarus clarkii]XP_045613317.1 zinc transporter ZIP1-like [Procambarus clarkii]XP_045613318.1 zinc transporter ZIP1-like [Procambarus clarkii]XP_045613319.1 zinc transporter ZIP1-like [Procambarus clarkii]